ncbi:MAG: hypothetical protein CMO82_07080 [Winogradskyella sp.]|uniref:Uncharacterized protein n=1 Tax=Winogradskyella poriferorum TaxID=307627 RepID=A0ABU7W8N4_9FLAO|nr:hypothetical protein [Winogradskyella sp.]|tara:strand:- start:235 stop:1377 length:1143 start_codon:yes stop_codon:yes gene_type:complete
MRILKISFYFFITLLVSFALNAQNKDVHEIELLPNETETVLSTDFYISEIIDNRIIKSNIGIAQKGLMNRKVLSDFSKDFDREILDYLETILPIDSSKTALSLRINQLLISEHTGAFKETGKAIVRLNVLVKLNDSIYGNYGSFEASRSKNSMDVTRKHDDRIRAVLKDCLMQFDSLDREVLVLKKLNPFSPESVKVLNDSIKQGFFETYMELANNSPIRDINFKIQNRTTDEKLHLKDTIINKKIMHFAYNDGENTYLNASTYSGERHYVKTDRFDDFLIFSDVFVNQDNVSGMSLAFGVLGVLMSNEHQTVLFDLSTGQFYPMTRTKMRLLLKKDYPEFYKKYKRNSRNHEMNKEIIQSIYKEKTSEEFRALITSLNN